VKNYNGNKIMVGGVAFALVDFWEDWLLDHLIIED